MALPKAAERDAQLQAVSFRAPPALREQLEQAASANGRSLTQELISRLELSFAEEGALSVFERGVANAIRRAARAKASKSKRGKISSRPRVRARRAALVSPPAPG